MPLRLAELTVTIGVNTTMARMALAAAEHEMVGLEADVWCGKPGGALARDLATEMARTTFYGYRSSMKYAIERVLRGEAVAVDLVRSGRRETYAAILATGAIPRMADPDARYVPRFIERLRNRWWEVKYATARLLTRTFRVKF